MLVKKIKYIALSLFLMMFLIRCFDPPEELVAPRWDVTLNVPLATDTVFMYDLLEADETNNLDIVDSPQWGDSIYLIIIDDIEAVSRIQDKLQVPVPLVPGSLNLSGYTGGQEIRSATVYNPDPEYHIDTAEFISGDLRFLMTNGSDFEAEYEIILPGFKDKDSGEMIVLSGIAQPNSDTPISFSLENTIYSELPVTGTNDINNFTTQESIGFMIVGIARTNNLLELNLTSRIDNSEITLNRLVGKLKRTEIDFFEETFSTDLGEDFEDFRENLNFDDIRMTVNAETFGQLSNVKIVLDSMTITGRELGTGNESVLQFDNLDYFRDSLIAGVSFSREFNKTNSNLNEFLSRIPDEVIIGNKLYIEKNPNAEDETQVISNSDSIKFIASIRAPLKIAVKEVSYDDTTDIDLSQDEKDALDNALSASVTIEVKSYIALGADLRIIFLDEDDNELFVLDDGSGNETFALLPAGVDNDGKPADPTDNTISMSLTESEIDLLLLAENVMFEASVNTTGSTSEEFGPYVRVRAKDYFTYKIYGTVDYHVNIDELD